MKTYKEDRLKLLFENLKKEKRGGLGIFIAASDPNLEISLEILKKLPQAGADMIELGMPFSDPMADGPTIQAASLRALKSGGSLKRTLEMVKNFRERDYKTPLVLMGYYNPILQMGLKAMLILILFIFSASKMGKLFKSRLLQKIFKKRYLMMKRVVIMLLMFRYLMTKQK